MTQQPYKPRKRRTNTPILNVNVRDTPVDTDFSFDYYVTLFTEFSTARNLSKHTVHFYGERLNRWRATLEKLGLSTSVHRITTDTIQAYIHHVTVERGLTYSTAATVLRAVRAFANYLQREGHIDSHGFETFTIAKPDQPAIQTFSERDITLLIEQIDVRTFTGIRDYTIVLLLLETGIRLRELCDITLNDVELSDRYIRIKGKNRHIRHVPFQAKFARVLRQYLRIRGDCETDALFITHEDKPISRRWVQQLIRRYGKQAGIVDVRVSPHTFRHTFAKWFIKNGGNVFALQKILGHSTLDMVRIYVNLFSSEVNDEHRKASPLNNILR